MLDEKELLRLLERAIRLAVNAHAGQLDKAGVPYILHPMRVMGTCETVSQKIVAILHDTVEDTAITLDSLRSEGFPEYIVEAIDSLTRRVEINESWEDFIYRCKANEIGRIVKRKDMRDNSDLHRMKEVEEKHLRMIKKYHWGMKQLRDEDHVYITIR